MSKSFKIQVITPSYVPENEQEVAKSLEKMGSYGFKIDYVHRAISKEYEPFWGSVEERAQEVIDAILGDYDAIWAVKGGYGAIQLMNKLDAESHILQKAKPKYLLGFSDITLLHYLMHKNLGWYGIHCNNFNSIVNEDQSCIDSISKFLLGTQDAFELNSLELLNNVAVNVEISRALGGNLCMMQNTISTPYHIDSKGCTLFIEDFDEPWYRIERMIYHLYNSEYIKYADAIVFGRLTADKDAEDAMYLIIKKFAKMLEEFNVPVFYTDEFGHKGLNKPILFGGIASIERRGDKYMLFTRRKK